MIRLTLTTLSCLALTSISLAQDLPEHGELTSPEGQAFWYVHLPEAERVAINIQFPSDWGHRDLESVATSILGPSLMELGGSGDLDGRQFSNASTDLSAFYSVDVNQQAVIFDAVLNPALAQDGAALLADFLAAPQFDPRWLTREIRQAKVDAAEPAFEAREKAYDLFTRWLYPGLPAGTLLRRDDPTIYDLVTPESLTAWHSETFHLAEAIPVIAGPLDEAEAGKLIDLLLADLPTTAPTDRALIPAPEANLSPVQILLVDPEADNAHARFWTPALPGQSLEQDAALTLATHMFSSGGLDAPLFEALRSELRATYGFSSSISEVASGQSYASFIGEISPDVLTIVPQVVTNTWHQYLSEGPTERAVTDLTSQIEASLPLRFQNASSVAGLASRAAIQGDYGLSEALSTYAVWAGLEQEDLQQILVQSFESEAALSHILISPTLIEGAFSCQLDSATDSLEAC